MPTIVSQIEITEKELEACEAKLDDIDRRLRLSYLTDAQIQHLQSEEKELKKEKKNFETSLSQLRKENGKNMFLSCVILALVMIIYYTFWVS